MKANCDEKKDISKRFRNINEFGEKLLHYEGQIFRLGNLLDEKV